jgi:hypothetical protein
MNRRNLAWLLVMAALTLVVTVSAPAFPWNDISTPPADEPEGLDSGDQPQDEAVEQILRQQEQLLTGQRFSYDPSGRRDPFRNLFLSLGMKAGGPRPKGAAGMLVAEMDLVGIVKDQQGHDKGLLIGSDNKGYFLSVGDAVFDGTVIAVDSRLGTVTFRQKVDDPRLIKPYRDVVKRLVPEDEESEE